MGAEIFMDFVQQYILNFPQSWQFKAGKVIDAMVMEFARDHRSGLELIKSGINCVRWFLSSVPWVVIVLFVALLSWYLMKKWYVGALYGAMLVFIGSCGLWNEMIETLSIVVMGVAVCVAFGFPLGVFLAVNPRANRIVRPILDTMQTMPSWVYLVPAVLLFQVGMTPALIATATYAIVPMVRMTSHGLIYVDKEMLEASYAFGSTKLQTLMKVQIPQAKPTIMAGVNQTIMMAMSMVVTCALIGAKGLGMEILIATNRVEVGRALFPGICIVMLAIILDRLTQVAVKRQDVLGEEADG